MSFWEEIKRRSVFKVGVAYLASAWLMVQIASIVLPAFAIRQTVMQALIVAFAIGLPIVLVCAWVYEITPDGIKRTDDVPVRRLGAIPDGRKLDFAIIAVLSLAVMTLVVDRYVIEANSPAGYDSIAVLPFANLSGDSEQEYFADGMTDSLIANLAKLGALKVISRTSAMRFKNTDLSLPEIAAALGASVIVEASTQRTGNNVRITAQLIDAKTDEHLWAETFDRSFEDILLLQSEMTQEIARRIELTVTDEEQELLADIDRVNPDAYDAYLKGMQHVYRLAPPELDLAEDYFELALTHDPDSALSSSGLALVWAARGQLGVIPASVAAEQARSYAERAEGLNDGLPGVHFALGVASYLQWDMPAAETHYRRAIALEPGHADAHTALANVLIIAARYAESVAEADRAAELDPLNPLYKVVRGTALFGARRYDESVAAFREALSIVPNLPGALFNIIEPLQLSGNLDEAIESEGAWLLARGDSEAQAGLQAGLAEGGFTEAMRRVAQVLEQRAVSVNAGAIGVARHYGRAGDAEKVIEWLRRGFEQRDPNTLMIRMPSFDIVRDDPRVRALIEQIGI